MITSCLTSSSQTSQSSAVMQNCFQKCPQETAAGVLTQLGIPNRIICFLSYLPAPPLELFQSWRSAQLLLSGSWIMATTLTVTVVKRSYCNSCTQLSCMFEYVPTVTAANQSNRQHGHWNGFSKIPRIIWLGKKHLSLYFLCCNLILPADTSYKEAQ